MKEPLFIPQQWVMYEHANGAGFGQITGGDFDGSDWYYSILGQLVQGPAVRVKESSIQLILDNHSWLPPVRQTSTDIYKEF